MWVRNARRGRRVAFSEMLLFTWYIRRNLDGFWTALSSSFAAEAEAGGKIRWKAMFQPFVERREF